MRLQDKVAIITGGGQGIGRAFAHRFAEEGATIVIADIQPDKAQHVVEELAETGTKGLAINVDVSSEESTQAMVAQTLETFGQVDILVNNASIFSTIKMKPFDEIPLAEWNQLMTVNLAGPFLCCKAVAAPMRSRQYGKIINIASSTVLMGRPFYAHYVTSKAGVIGLTRVLAKELGPQNINVNAIMPGFTQTEIPRETVTPAQREHIIGNQSLQRQGVAADIVGAAVFLAADESSFMTGQVLTVDGGHNFY